MKKIKILKKFFLFILSIQFVFAYINFDKFMFNNIYSPELALFNAYVSDEVYNFNEVKLFLKSGGFKDISLIEDKNDLLNIDMQAVVAYKNINGKKIVLIAFRGTSSLDDVGIDLTLNKTQFFNTHTKVHTGFYASLIHFIEKENNIFIDNKTLKEIIKNPDYRIIVTGHSLGGAIATLYGAYLSTFKERNKDNFVVYTYGAPAVGDEKFAEEFAGKVPLYRIINEGDPIPNSTCFSALLSKNFQYYHITNPIVYNNYGEVIQNYDVTNCDLQTNIFKHSITNYITDLKMAIYYKNRNNYKTCKDLNLIDKDLFVCDDKYNIYYPDMLESFNKIGSVSYIGSLFDNNTDIYTLLKNDRENYEKKALESFILLDSTGLFKDQLLLSVLVGENNPSILKGEVDTNLSSLKAKNDLLTNILKGTILFYELKHKNFDDRRKTFFKDDTYLLEKINFALRDYKLADYMQKEKLKDILVKINQVLKREKIPEIEINNKTINELYDYLRYNVFNLVDDLINQKTPKALGEYISNYMSFKPVKDVASFSATALGIMTAPIFEFAQYQKENIEYRKRILYLLKPYISENTYYDILEKLNTIEKTNIENMFKIYYSDPYNFAKMFYDSFSAVKDFSEILKNVFPKFSLKLAYYAEKYMPTFSKGLKFVNGTIFNFAGIVFDELDIIKAENDYKTLLISSAMSSSLAKMFMRDNTLTDRILSDTLMLNSRKLMNMAIYYNGGYNLSSDKEGVDKFIEEMGGYTGAFVDIGSSILAKGLIIGIIDNKVSTAFRRVSYNEQILNTLGNAFDMTNNIYNTYANDIILLRKNLLGKDSSSFTIRPIYSPMFIYKNKKISQFYMNSTYFIRYYLPTTKSKELDIAYNQHTAPNYKYYIFNLFYNNDKLEINQAFEGKDDNFRSQSEEFVVTTFDKDNNRLKSIHFRTFPDKIEYIYDLNRTAKISQIQKSSLTALRKAIGYENGYNLFFNELLIHHNITAYNFDFKNAKPLNKKWLVIVNNPDFTFSIFFGKNQNDLNYLRLPYSILLLSNVAYFDFPQEVYIFRTNLYDLASYLKQYIWNYLQFESKNKTLQEITEKFKDKNFSLYNDLNENSYPYNIQDFDGDGLSNFYEKIIGTDPFNKDTDDDGIIDSMDPEPLIDNSGIKKTTIKLNTLSVKILTKPTLYNNEALYLTYEKDDSPYKKLYLVKGDKKLFISKVFEDYIYNNPSFNFKLKAISNTALVKYRKDADNFNIAIINLTNMKLIKTITLDDISYPIINSLLSSKTIYSDEANYVYIFNNIDSFEAYELKDFLKNPTIDKLKDISYKNTLKTAKIRISPIYYQVKKDYLFAITQDYNGYTFYVINLNTQNTISTKKLPVDIGLNAPEISMEPINQNNVYFIFNGILYEYKNGSISKIMPMNGKIVGMKGNDLLIAKNDRIVHFNTLNNTISLMEKFEGNIDYSKIIIKDNNFITYQNNNLYYTTNINVTQNPTEISSNNENINDNQNNDNCIINNALNKNYDLDEKGIWKYALSSKKDAIYLKETTIDGESVIEIQGDQKSGSYGLVLSTKKLSDGFQENLKQGNYIAYIRLKADKDININVVAGNKEVLNTAKEYSFSISTTFKWIKVPFKYKMINGVTRDYVGVGFKNLDSRIYIDKIVFLKGDTTCEINNSCNGLDEVSCKCKSRIVGEVDTYLAHSIALAGKYAYVADVGEGLKIIDISNPSSPKLVGKIDTTDALDVVVSEKYAYIADDYYGGLKIIDISNPLSPKLVGKIDTDGTAHSVVVSGKYAYVADENKGLKIIDISNPSSPKLVGKIDTDGIAYSVVVSGKYAYVADENKGLKIIDISNPSSPKLVGKIDTSYALDVVVSEKYAYIADGYYGGLKIIDISNPLSPKLVGKIDTDGKAHSVVVSGKYAYVADENKGLKIIDISNPSSPKLVGKIDTDGKAHSVVVSGKYAYVANGDKGLIIEDWKKTIECYELTHKNNPPKIISFTKTLEAKIANSISLTFKAYDKDNDTLTWSINNKTFSGSEVTYEFTPTKPGVYKITAKVSDGKESDEVVSKVIVYPDNDNPVTSNFFKDMESYKTSWSEAYKSVYDLLNRGIIKGELGSDGVYYYPQRDASKLEFSKVFVKTICNQYDKEKEFVNKCLESLGYKGDILIPKNINDINDDVKNYAIVAYNLGVFGDPIVIPYVNFGDKISRIEVARFLVKALRLKYIDEMNEYLKSFSDTLSLNLQDQIDIQLVNYYGYLRGDKNKFYPLSPINRIQLAVLAERLLNAPKISIKNNTINVTLSKPITIKSKDGNVYVDNNLVATYIPKDANVSIYINGEKSNIINKPMVSNVDIIIQKNNLRAGDSIIVSAQEDLSKYSQIIDNIINSYEIGNSELDNNETNITSSESNNTQSNQNNNNETNTSLETITAFNPTTGEVKEFNSTTDIPKDWIEGMPIIINIPKGISLVSGNIDFHNLQDKHILIIWSLDPKTQEWIAYSPSERIRQKIKANGFKFIDKIDANRAFFVVANAPTKLVTYENIDDINETIHITNLPKGYSLVGSNNTEMSIDDIRCQDGYIVGGIFKYQSGKWQYIIPSQNRYDFRTIELNEGVLVQCIPQRGEK